MVPEGKRTEVETWRKGLQLGGEGRLKGGAGTFTGRATEAYGRETVVGAAQIGIESPKGGNSNSDIDGGADEATLQ